MPKKLAAVLTTLEGVADETKELYTANQDGSFDLNIEGQPRGFVPSATHEEFRSNNTTLKRDLDAANERLGTFDGIDPVKAKELLATADELDRKALIKSGDIDGLVEAAVEKSNKPLLERLEASESNAARYKTQADSAIVDTKVLSAAGDFGKVKKGAGSVVVSKARDAGWQNVDGNLLQMKGDDVVGRDIDAWITENAAAGQELAFCFEATTGGGGDGGDGGTVTPEGTKVIPREEFSKNIDDVAKGKTTVAPRE